MIEEALYYRLTNTAAITALVSTRVYAMDAEQLDYDARNPKIVFSRTGGADDQVAEGTSGFTKADFEVVCYGDSIQSARNVADAVHAALSGFYGSWDTTTIHNCLMTGQRELAIPPASGQQLSIYTVTQDYAVAFNAPAIQT